MSSQTKITVLLDGDDTRLSQSLQRAARAAGATSVTVQDLGQHSGASFSAMEGAAGGLSTTLSELGVNGGPVEDLFTSLDAVFSRVDEKAGRLRTGLLAVGAGLTAVGALTTAMGAKEKQAQELLANTIENTGHSYEEYAEKIEAAIGSQAKLGNNAGQVMGALNTLTGATGSADTALQQLGLTADLAAYKNESLGEAAQQVADIYAGRYRSILGIIGVQAKQIVDTTGELTRAQKEQAAATAEQQKANEQLSDAQAKAQAAQQTADQTLSDLQARLAQSQQDAQTKADQAVQDADEKLTDAKQDLLDVQQKLADQASQSLSQAHDLAQAQEAVANVQRRIAEGSLSGGDAEEQLQQAQEQLQYVQAQQDAQHQASQAEQEDLQKKTQATAAAQAADEAAHKKAQAAGALTLSQQQELARAQKAAAGAGQTSGLSAAQAAVRKANADAAKAQADMASANADLQKYGTTQQQYLKDLQKTVGGAAKATSQGLEGEFHAFLAELDNKMSSFGQKYGTTLLGIGVLMSSVGSMAMPELAVPIMMALGDILMAALPWVAAIAVVGLIAYEIYKHWDTVKHLLGVAWQWIRDTAVRLFNDVWHFLERWGPLILTVLAPVIGLPLLIWQHWSQITGFVERALGGAWDKIKGWGENVVDFFTGLPGRLAGVGRGMWDWISDGFIDVINLVIQAWDWLTSKLQVPSFDIGYGPLKKHFGGVDIGSHLYITPFGTPGAGSASAGSYGGLGRRAGGGPVSRGMSYLVGEQRPEIFTPDRDGFIVPHVPQLSAAAATSPSGFVGGDTHIEVNINGGTYADDQSMRRLGDQLTDHVLAGLLRRQRSGVDLGIKPTANVSIR